MRKHLIGTTLVVLAIFSLCLGDDRPATETTPADAGKQATDKAAPAKAAPLTAPKPKPVATPTPQELQGALDRGIAFLVKRQNTNGSWGTERSSRPSEVMAPVPGAHYAFRAAVTAMCISALIETGGDRADVQQTLDRAETWFLKHLELVRRGSTECIYNNWAHAYGIDALVHMLRRRTDDAPRAAKIRLLLAGQIEMLKRYECVDGGWAYYDFKYHTQKPSGSTISFVTATALISLYEAKQVGIEAPKPMVDRAIASIRRQRKPDFSYFYGEYLKNAPLMPVNRPGGSLGRTQNCNLAMRLWGDTTVTDEVLRVWLDRFFARNGWLDIGRKRPIPHESWFQVAGYFFYFGHYYAGRCIELLPVAERGPYQDQLGQVLLHLQEKDGSWWDFPFYDYHQQYGTAFAMMTLKRCFRQ